MFIREIKNSSSLSVKIHLQKLQFDELCRDLTLLIAVDDKCC